MLTDKTFSELLKSFSAPDPTPGGGTAAAMAGAIGASLLVMVTGLPKSRRNSDEDRAALAKAAEALAPLRDALLQLAQADTDAYDAVVAAYRLPKSTDEEKAARRAAVQRAMRRATDVPLDVMRSCAAALSHAARVAAHGNPSAASDVLVGTGLLMAALEGAKENVTINLPGLGDAGFQAEIAAEVDALSADAAGDAAGVRAIVRG
jgi:formiminotetrahydrofolate cyclodeaminase